MSIPFQYSDVLSPSGKPPAQPLPRFFQFGPRPALLRGAQGLRVLGHVGLTGDAAAQVLRRRADAAMLAVSLKEKDFAETSRLLTTVREKFPRRMPNLKDNPAYTEYTHSPQYCEWVNGKKP
jgi:hypothetical protein